MDDKQHKDPQESKLYYKRKQVNGLNGLLGCREDLSIEYFERETEKRKIYGKAELQRQQDELRVSGGHPPILPAGAGVPGVRQQVQVDRRRRGERDGGVRPRRDQAHPDRGLGPGSQRGAEEEIKHRIGNNGEAFCVISG